MTRFQRLPALGGLLLLLVAARLAASLSADAPPAWVDNLSPIATSDWNAARAAHLMERAGFGATPEEIGRLAARTPQQAVDALVDFMAIDDRGLPPFEESGVWDPGMDPFPPSRAEAVRIARERGQSLGVKVLAEGTPRRIQPVVDKFFYGLRTNMIETQRLAVWWADRMLRTPRPLQEKLTLFWHGHFATGQNKVRDYRMMMRQNALFRTQAAGNFRELLVGVMKDPAMLVYLDNGENVKKHPNENFGRELLELFTMGVGNYSERDVREAARAFTGWTNDVLTFRFDAEQHDFGEKAFLDRSGAFNGEDIIDAILRHPVTAEFMAAKLYRYFVREAMSDQVKRELGQTFRSSGYDMRPLLKRIFLSKDFYSDPSVGTQIKSPVILVVSTYKKMGLRELPTIPDPGRMTGGLGQTLFEPPNVAGWAGHKTWINPATLLTRGNFVNELLFPPDPMTIEPPDKDIHEGYRKIPVMFPEYNITPYIWSNTTQRMEPVSLAVYDQYLAGMDTTKAMQMMAEGGGKSDEEMKNMLASNRVETKSQMGKVAAGEQYNLAVGVYTGHVRANERVKAIPRTSAAMDFAAMAKAANVKTASEAVDYFMRRFLSVEIQADRCAAIVEFAVSEIGSDTIDYSDAKLEAAMRQIVYLVLSAPEYQLA